MKIDWGRMEVGAGTKVHAFVDDATRSLCFMVPRLSAKMRDGRPPAEDACGQCKMHLREWPEGDEVERLRRALRSIQVDLFNLGNPAGLLSSITTGNLPHRIQHARSACREMNRIAVEALGPEHDVWARKEEP